MANLRKVEKNFAEQELQLLNDKREVIARKIEEEEAHLCQIRTQIMVN